ncbi:glycosyltransferase [Boseongicola aestuarii]|uniref:Chitooligosaccharide deacetylase n=1 Tax=Boseongicola aestuarii TaxID=1470561 RepID=A0A238IWX2_9RHOB|nr:glycosyltransferase [Boseongicola aestuarii]SMX22541.1 Poly-beta-1,6-N-acetyl-D-glucosamine synthase [Boseongicola aestuarii]
MKKPDQPGNHRKVRPVFFDPTSHRLTVVSVLFFAFIILVLVWAFSFSKSLYDARLPALPGQFEVGAPTDKAAADSIAALTRSEPPEAPMVIPGPRITRFPKAPVASAPSVEIHAFFPFWSRQALDIAKARIDDIDVLLPELFAIDPEQAGIAELTADHTRDLRLFIDFNRDTKRLLPVVRLSGPDSNRWNTWLESDAQRRAVATSAAGIVEQNNFDGLCFDVTGAPQHHLGNVVEFLTTARDALAGIGGESCLVASLFDPLWDSPDAADLADRLIALGFQLPGPFSAPGPLAPQDAVDEKFASLFNRFDAQKVVVGLGSLGVNWTSGNPIPEEIGYFDLTTNASLFAATVRLDPHSLNTTTAFTDAEGRLHQMWVLDAVAAHNTLKGLKGRSTGGFALWPLGGEDPAIWTLLVDDADEGASSAVAAYRVNAPDFVRYEGKGALLSIRIGAHDGLRRLTLDQGSGRIVGMHYPVLPTAYTLTRHGGQQVGGVVLTFDDGPDPKYTPEILDILDVHDTPAVFFLIGSKVLEYPEIARRIVAEGHEIGAHTYSHPNLADIGALRLRMEMHATQQLLAEVTGTNTLLFRAPYGLDEDPKTIGEANALRTILSGGYVVVGIEHDSFDWSRRGVANITDALVGSFLAKGGGVALLHDGGGDRSQTVRALPDVIAATRQQGFEFVSLASLYPALEQLVIVSPQAETDPLRHFSFAGIRAFQTALTTIFFVTILAGVFRSTLIVLLALRQHRHLRSPSDYRPAVTVAIPAYCEEPVIVRTISAVLASDYPIEEVIVVDDGSLDGTADAVRQAFGPDDRVRLVVQENRGKAEALNHIHALATTPIIVAVDADTILAPDAIRFLVSHFADPKVGAVAGNVKVGNRRNLLTLLQAIEYITAQNLDRRAYETLNGIMVVPGAIGAWRAEAVDAAAGYSSETLVEDADLTISIIRAGYQVNYEPNAKAFTEAPETIRQFIRQRIRWTFGMLQAAWKHKTAIRERWAVGLVAIPDMLVFGILFSLFAPLADIVLIVNLAQILSGLMSAGENGVSPLSMSIVVGYLAYLFSDMLLAAIAMSLERDEDRRILPAVLTQRFFYRQIFWFVVLWSVARALTGRFGGWRKVTRTATVSPEEALSMPRSKRRIVEDIRNGRESSSPSLE